MFFSPRTDTRIRGSKRQNVETLEASVLNVALVQGGGTSDYFGWWMRSDNIATSDPQRLNFWGSKYFQVAICG